MTHAATIPHYMPEQWVEGIGWSPLWYCAIPYRRAADIRNQALGSLPRDSVRVRYVGHGIPA